MNTRETRSNFSEMETRAEDLLDWIDWLVSRGNERMLPNDRLVMWRERMAELAEVYGCR